MLTLILTYMRTVFAPHHVYYVQWYPSTSKLSKKLKIGILTKFQA